MTTLNGVVGIDFNLTAIVACTSLSSHRAVLIHQFDDRLRSFHPFTRQAAARSVRNLLLRAPVRPTEVDHAEASKTPDLPSMRADIRPPIAREVTRRNQISFRVRGSMR